VIAPVNLGGALHVRLVEFFEFVLQALVYGPQFGHSVGLSSIVSLEGRCPSPLDERRPRDRVGYILPCYACKLQGNGRSVTVPQAVGEFRKKWGGQKGQRGS